MHKERFYLTIKEFKDIIVNRFPILLLQFDQKKNIYELYYLLLQLNNYNLIKSLISLISLIEISIILIIKY